LDEIEKCINENKFKIFNMLLEKGKKYEAEKYTKRYFDQFITFDENMDWSNKLNNQVKWRI